MDEAVDHDLLVEGLQELAGDLGADRPLGHERDRTAAHVVHDQQPRRRVVTVDVRDGQPRVPLDHGRHPDHVPCLAPEVELPVQRRREVLEHGAHVEHRAEARPIRDLLGEQLEQREVLLDELPGVRSLHLGDDLLAVREDRPVHLRDGPGGEREGIDPVEDVFPGDAQLLLHDPDDLLLAERRDVVLQGRELVDELRREEVGPRGQHLTELAEGGAELLERGAHALGLSLPADRPLLIGPAEELPQPVLGEDGGDLRAAGGQARLGLGLDVGAPEHRGALGVPDRGHGPVRGVHDDDRAAGVVADPVRHVAEQELLASRHAGVPHDEDVDGVLLGRMHDGHGRVVVQDDVGAAALARQTRRLDLELVGGAGRLGPLGGPELGGCRVGGQDHLHDVELGAEPSRERRRPTDRTGGRLGAVRSHHHATDGFSNEDIRCVGHVRMMPGPGLRAKCVGPTGRRRCRYEGRCLRRW